MNDHQSHPHELISAMHDGEIDERERAVVEAHLRECAACRDLAGDLAALGEVLGDEPVPPVPAGLASRIGWSLRAQGASRRRIAGIRWPGPRLAALGGVAAAAVLAVLIVREGGAPYRWSRNDLREPALPARANAVGAGAAESDDLTAARKPAQDNAAARDRLQSLGYADADHEGSSLGSGSRDGRGASGEVGRPEPGRGAGGSASSAQKRDAFAYAAAPPPPPTPTESVSGSPAPAAPLSPPALDKQAQGDLRKLEAGGVSSSTGIFAADLPVSPEQAKKTAPTTAPAAAEEKKEQAEGYLEGGGKELPQLPAKPPSAAEVRAARAEPNALSNSKAKVIDNESQARPVIPPCPGAEGATPVKRWTATSAPLPLRAVRSDAEPDLAGLAARLGGSLCADTASGGAPLLVLDIPVARWIDLRDALIARAAAEPSLSAPPVDGFDVVRVVVRPR
jgi:hypothetical protein